MRGVVIDPAAMDANEDGVEMDDADEAGEGGGEFKDDLSSASGLSNNSTAPRWRIDAKWID